MLDHLASGRNLDDVYTACSIHLGVVVDNEPPDGEGLENRVRISVPSFYGEGEENNSDWVPFAGMPLGQASATTKGDVGVHWVPQVGSTVLFALLSGDEDKKICWPGPAWSNEEDGNRPQVPKEVREIYKKKGVKYGVRVKQIKSESGHAIMMCDYPGEEAFTISDNIGNTFYMFSPSKGKYKGKTKGKGDSEFSEVRKEDRREDKFSVTQDSKEVSASTKSGVSYCGFTDVGGNGFNTIADGSNGTLVLKASKNKGSTADSDVCSIVLDTKNNKIILTAGEAQFVVDGKRGKNYSHCMLIVQEQIKITMSSLMSKIKNSANTYFRKILGKSISV